MANCLWPSPVDSIQSSGAPCACHVAEFPDGGRAGTMACPVKILEVWRERARGAARLDVLGVEDCRDGVEGRGDADAGYYGFGVQALFQDYGVVGFYAGFAALDGGGGQAGEFEIDRVAAMCADGLHAEAGGDLFVVGLADHVAEPVEDVVQAHDGAGGLGRIELLGRELGGGFGDDGGGELGIAASHGAGDGDGPGLLFGQLLLLEDVLEVDALVLGVIGDGVGELLKCHDGRMIPFRV